MGLKILKTELYLTQIYHLSLIIYHHIFEVSCTSHTFYVAIFFSDFGIGGRALEWFSLYFSGRSQRVLFEGATSDSFDLRFGVPQDSCLGPLSLQAL